MSMILGSEQFGPLMASLGLPVSGEMGVLGFLKVLENLHSTFLFFIVALAHLCIKEVIIKCANDLTRNVCGATS